MLGSGYTKGAAAGYLVGRAHQELPLGSERLRRASRVRGAQAPSHATQAARAASCDTGRPHVDPAGGACGHGYLVSGPASSWECRAAQSRQARPALTLTRSHRHRRHRRSHCLTKGVPAGTSSAASA